MCVFHSRIRLCRAPRRENPNNLLLLRKIQIYTSFPNLCHVLHSELLLFIKVAEKLLAEISVNLGLTNVHTGTTGTNIQSQYKELMRQSGTDELHMVCVKGKFKIHYSRVLVCGGHNENTKYSLALDFMKIPQRFLLIVKKYMYMFTVFSFFLLQTTQSQPVFKQQMTELTWFYPLKCKIISQMWCWIFKNNCKVNKKINFDFLFPVFIFILFLF